MPKCSTTDRNLRFHSRRGTAVVEFAVCMPLIMLLILGSIEATSAIFLKQSLTTAAYEGIREASRSGTSKISADRRSTDILDLRKVQKYKIQFTPADVSTAKRGERVAIEISAPLSSNSPFIGKVITDRTTKVRLVMVKQ